MHKHTWLNVALFICVSAVPTWASWNWVSLHPEGCKSSQAVSINNGKAAGLCTTDGYYSATVWDMQSGSRCDITPPGTLGAGIRSISSGSQAGFIKVTNPSGYSAVDHAALWNGSADNFVDLHPDGYLESEARAISGGQQVGHAYVRVNPHLISPHAGLWTGTADSWVDLNPAGAETSSASTVCNGRQGGGVAKPEWRNVWIGTILHASLWAGTAESWVDVNPAGAVYSQINGMDGNQQVGIASFESTRLINHAGYWRGTSASWVDLHPYTARTSVGIGVSNGWQVGFITDQYDQLRASIWNGTASSWQNLHSLLPDYYINSSAMAVEVTDKGIWVVGSAYNYNTYRNEAMLWYQAVPEPGSLATVILGILSFGGVMRHRSQRL